MQGMLEPYNAKGVGSACLLGERDRVKSMQTCCDHVNLVIARFCADGSGFFSDDRVSAGHDGSLNGFQGCENDIYTH